MNSPSPPLNPDTAAIGNPDPTCDVKIADSCANYHLREGWRCTRAAGHSGQHVAGNGTKVCAVWG